MRRISSTHSSSTRILREVVYVRNMPSNSVARLHMDTELMEMSPRENTRSAMRHSSLSSVSESEGGREGIWKVREVVCSHFKR